MSTACTVQFFCVTCGDGREMSAEEREDGLLDLVCGACGEHYSNIPREAVERFEAASSSPSEEAEPSGGGDEAATPRALRQKIEGETSEGTDQPAEEAPPEPRPRHAVEKARRIAERHRLPFLLALQVAEGRLSLAQAQAKARNAAAGSSAAPRAGFDRRAAWLAVAASGLALLLLLLTPRRAGEETAPGEEAPPPAAAAAPRERPAPRPPARPLPPKALVELQRTAGGELAGITAPTPEAVLETFCRRASYRCLEPVGIGPTLPMRSRTRLGLYISRRADPPFRAIRIVYRPEEHGWRAGDGKSPIPSVPAPDYPDGVVIHPVRGGS
ncbi:MAG: hypothetical protein D6718_12060 [Acidobacteria bacterium]|nr:MAG: hypothetical protein D6718_12060 [Acidobacteriota bacterium]